VLLVSLAAGSFVGTYLSIVSDNGKAMVRLWDNFGTVRS